MSFLSLSETVAVVVMVGAGATAHEIGHWTIGAAFGAAPTVSKYQLGLPARISFEQPDELSRLQVRIVTGYVIMFPLLAIPALWQQRLFASAFLVGAALTISATDLLGLYHPRAWARVANGQKISDADLEDPEFWE